MKEMEKLEKVFINEEAKTYFPGMTVRFAIGPGLAKLVEQGLKKVVDDYGYEVGLEGSLSPGSKIAVMDNPRRK